MLVLNSCEKLLKGKIQPKKMSRRSQNRSKRMCQQSVEDMLHFINNLEEIDIRNLSLNYASNFLKQDK